MARKKTVPAEEPVHVPEEASEAAAPQENAREPIPEEGMTPCMADSPPAAAAPEAEPHGADYPHDPDTAMPPEEALLDADPQNASRSLSEAPGSVESTAPSDPLETPAAEPLPPENTAESREWPPAESETWPEWCDWEHGTSVPGVGLGNPFPAPHQEVLSVDLSTPAEMPQLPPESPEDPLEDGPLGDAKLAVPAQEQEEPLVLPEEIAREELPQKTDRQKFFELKFNRLDRDLTPEERQEWNSIYASYRGHSAITGTIIGIDPFHVDVWNRETETTERQTMFCAIVIPYRVRIVIPSTEMWDRGWERPDFVLQNMVGSTISFIITKVDRESGFAIASRRLALRASRYFFSHRPQLHAIGARVKCRVMAVGPRRSLIECYGHDLNLTQRELRYTAIPDLRTEYHPGQELECIVKLYDPEADRLEISVKETESNPYDGAEIRHPVGSRRLGVIAGKYGGGVFCNLPDGTVCMCNYSYQHEDSDFLIGDTVILVIQRFDEEKKEMYGKILSKW